jgi:integrase
MPEGITAAAAKDRARRQLAAALAGGFNPKQEAERRLASALEEYIKWRRANGRAAVHKQEASAKRLVASLSDVELAAVVPFAIERFKRDRQAAGAGPATVNRDLAVLRHFFTMAGKWGWCPKAQVLVVREAPLLKEPPGRVRHLSLEEAGRLMTALERRPRMRRIVLAALLTGMREGEIIGLRREAVDLAAGEITLTRTKSNRVRRIPIADALVPVLKEALGASRSGYVFESRKGEPYSENGLRSSWDGVRTDAELEDFHFHDLRHSAATTLRRRGAGLDVIAKILGHTSLAMTQRYAHVGEDLVRTAMASLPSPFGPTMATPPALTVVK